MDFQNDEDFAEGWEVREPDEVPVDLDFGGVNSVLGVVDEEISFFLVVQDLRREYRDIGQFHSALGNGFLRIDFDCE